MDLATSSATLTLPTWMRSLRNDLQSKSFKLAQWQETRLFSCRNACQHQWWQIIRTSSAAAEIDKPLRAQSKSPDVYSRIRECVRNCQCNAINLNQTCHMNSLCNQRSGCLPLASKSCFCCSETQNTCLTSWYWVVRAHWVVRAQWWLAWGRRKLRFSEWIQQYRQQDWLLPLSRSFKLAVFSCGNVWQHKWSQWSEHLAPLLK